MRLIVTNIDYKKRLFYAIINNKKYAFYLTNRLSKIYLPLLSNKVLVDFKVGKRQLKKYKEGYIFVYKVEYFNEIISLNPKRVLYDIYELRKQMKDVVHKYQKLLFIDFEMTMPGYRKGKFTPEIIQVGYVLTDNKNNILLKNSYYLLPRNDNAINKRTKKFLNLNENVFYGKAKDYHFFYHDLKKIIKEHNPQLVVWGKNDVDVLNSSYDLHKKEPLTNGSMFIDLLTLHKNFYNLNNDLGLFSAYSKYYNLNNINQEHHAMADANITRLVFVAFKKVLDTL